MAKVPGLGGVVLTSPEPQRLRAWYARWLGLYADGPGIEFYPDTMPEGACATLTVLSDDTRYLEPSTRGFMLALVVDDLDAMPERARAGGAQVMPGTLDDESGRYGWFVDPDGHKVESWQPSAV